MIEVTSKMVDAFRDSYRLRKSLGKPDYDATALSIEAALAVREPVDAGTIIKLLLSIPESEREDFILDVRNNGFFCFSCGRGSVEHPNQNCQCENNE